MLDKLPGLWYSDHRPGNYNYKEDKLCAFGLMMRALRQRDIIGVKALMKRNFKLRSMSLFLPYPDCMEDIELIDLDHDAGDYANDGGDYINLLNWLEEIGRNYPIRIHSMNPVGVENMRRIIKRNGWTEVK